jgi:Heterokaryon incompatibility protein (HET)
MRHAGFDQDLETVLIKGSFYIIAPVMFCVYFFVYCIIYAIAVVCSWPIESGVLCLGFYIYLMCPEEYRPRSLSLPHRRTLCPWILARRIRRMIYLRSWTLKRRAHETINEFTHSALPLEPRAIRLLEIHPSLIEGVQMVCSLVDCTLDQTHEYEALSYRWGDPADAPTDQIICNGQTLLVKKNLFNALNRLRKVDTKRRIWVDAICIDQENKKEKSSQLTLMPDIYRGCSRVVIWLGEHLKYADTTTQLMADIQLQVIYPGRDLDPKFVAESRTNPHDVLRFLGLPSIVSSKWYALSHIANDAYWDRMWIIQEVLLGSSHTIYFGRHQVPLHYLFDSLMTMSIFRIPVAPGVGLQQLLQLRDKGAGRKKLGLWKLIEYSRLSEATDPLDKVYALYGLTDDPDSGGIALPVDYTMSQEKFFRKVAAIWLQDSRTLVALALASTAAERDSTLESWLPNFERSSAGLLLPSLDGDIDLYNPELRSFMASDSDIEIKDCRLGIVGVIQREKIQSCGPTMKPLKFTPPGSFMQSGPLSTLTSKIFSSWLSMAFKDHSGPKRSPRMRELFHALHVECSSREVPAMFERFKKWTRVQRMRGAVGALRLYWIHWAVNELLCAIIQISWGLLGGMDTRYENAIPPPFAYNRQLCITDAGKLVLGPAGAEKGDIIVVARGWHMPLILRRNGDDHGPMKFIGDAWIPYLSSFSDTHDEERIWLK